MMKNCFNCGCSRVETHSGTYYFHPPEKFGVDYVEMPNAWWIECDNCGYVMLPPELSQRLELWATQQPAWGT